MLRRFVALYLLAVIGGAQALFAVEQWAGARLPVLPSLVAALLVWPLALALGGQKRGWLTTPAAPSPAWLAMGLMLFGAWATGYFLIGAWVDPSRIHVFDTRFEDPLPFLPTSSLLYLCVHPLFLVPFAVLPDAQGLRRHAAACALVMGVSFVCWAALPVAFPRPEVPPDAVGLGAWALRVVQGSDPPVNCFPSTHAAMAALAALALFGARSRLGPWMIVTALLIGLSTVLTRQHYWGDAAAGYLLGTAAYFIGARLRPAAR